MKKWVVNIKQGESRNAVVKPKDDVTKISNNLGYHNLDIVMQNTRALPLESLRMMIDTIISEVESGDFVIYQYPTLLGSRFEEVFIERLNHKECKIILLIHDSEWLRGTYLKEKDLFNLTDVIIGHGLSMNRALENYGVKTKIIAKDLFDYIPFSPISLEESIEKKLVIAGNLDKSIFIENWSSDMPELHAFGLKSNNNFGDNVHYHGSYTGEELNENIPKNYFGIAWDDKLPGGGDYQRYTRYNSPHKISLYLSLGMPVIVWEHSGISKFITDNELGFSILSPEDIKRKLENLSDQQMIKYKKNANNISVAISNGMFTRKSILEAESFLFGFSNLVTL